LLYRSSGARILGDAMVAFTFDDGPDPVGTPLILDALDGAAVKATFFVVAEQIESDGGSALLRQILDRGHAVQMHCGAHVPHPWLSLEGLRDDAQRIESALAVHGVEPSLWRPPYGRLSDFSCRAAGERGRQLILWTYSPSDWVGHSAAAMLQRADGRLYPDSVILLHDSRRYAPEYPQNVQPTAELIMPLAARIRDQGWECGALTARFQAREQRTDEEPLLPCATA
jgi:peptidoglycan-N-acetylglucosamine deacetylase